MRAVNAGATCAVDACGRPAKTKGLCGKHYNRQWAGLPLVPDARPTSCSEPLCDAAPYAKSLCSRHYNRLLRHGSPSVHKRPELLETEAERFAQKVRIAESGCHEWTGARIRGGYGMFRQGRGHVTAHRFAWQSVNGPIPEGLEIDHLCSNPSCVRVDHLEPVTHAENVRRAVSRRAAS